MRSEISDRFGEVTELLGDHPDYLFCELKLSGRTLPNS